MWTYSWWSSSKTPRYILEQIKKKLKKTSQNLKKLAEKESPKKLQDEIKAEKLLEEVSWIDDTTTL